MEIVTEWPEVGHYDLICGLVGVGVLAHEATLAGSEELGGALFDAALSQLARRAQPASSGSTWWTSPLLLPEHQREKAPDGYFNFGVAHGIPGIVGLLGLRELRSQEAEPQRLLEGAVAGLLDEERAGDVSHFACWRARGGDPAPGRLAWCYGDPGVAVTLLLAAESQRGELAGRWSGFALDLARSAFSSRDGRRGIVDAGLCHGAAGLAHLGNRIYQHTRDTFFLEQAGRWLEWTLRFRKPGSGCGGYLAWSPTANLEPGWAPQPGFLTGAAGIGLALLAAATNIEPEWDRLLLASLPPALPGR